MPCETGFGVPDAKTERSICPGVATTVVADAELLVGFASGVDAEILSVAVMTVPEAVPSGTPRTREKVAVPPEAMEAAIQVMVPPVEPTAGSGAQFQPPGEVSD